MSREALNDVVDQARDLLSEIVAAYSAEVAPGEVGAGGSARASLARAHGGEGPTGLMYGLIQSGKTVAMILSSALAVDNRFRVIVVLTANNVNLVKQTAQRFEALDGPLIYSSNATAGGEYEWEAERGNIERHLGSHGVVFVCAKEANHQRALIAFLREIGAANYPALIFDDEADHATPDTTLARRAAGRPNAPAHGSTTYRLTIENDAVAEAGESIREVLRHNVFVQVTATPYGLLLQRYESPLRPKFTKLIEPGDGYRGGEAFFEVVGPDSTSARPPLVYVSDQDARALDQGSATAPDGLQRSVAFFLLAATAHRQAAGRWPNEGYKHLSHTSPRTAAHEHLAQLLRQYADALADEFATDRSTVASRPEFEWAFRELRRTVPGAPPLDELLADIQRRIPRRKIVTINAQGNEQSFGHHYNFMVGGNILGRGLTIDDLLVTYYLRQAQTTQMDTMLQHARMYGYRERLMPYTRVFLPHRLALRFKSIHESEQQLRDLLEEADHGARIPISVVNGLRPTRPGINDSGSLATYRPGKRVYPIEPVYEPELLGDATARIESHLQELLGGLPMGQFHDISLDEMAALIEEIPIREDEPGSWNTSAIQQVLKAISEKYRGRGAVLLRTMTRSSRVLVSGALDGSPGGEIDRAKQLNRPVLFLIRESGVRPAGEQNPWSGVPFWYPDLIFPGDMPNQVFNASR